MKDIPNEEKSSAVSLSDMEIFVFPELMYALVLANILSPRLWAWRDLPWFDGIREMRPKKRLQRLRQHIMDNYTFNLDLETWGLTTQQRELARFAPFLSPDEITKSNALFGYQGDVYYYDIDIRRHFGLDKYDIDIRRHFGLDKYAGDVIPYWKTETIEAMDAFRHKKGHAVGAGECVSLAGLYAAAAFVVCGLPLESIYLMATPLHSQNFLDVDTGILTNNRRLVTKAMWANGTVIDRLARNRLHPPALPHGHDRSRRLRGFLAQAHVVPRATRGRGRHAPRHAAPARRDARLVRPLRRPARPHARNGPRRNRPTSRRPPHHESRRRARPLRRA